MNMRTPCLWAAFSFLLASASGFIADEQNEQPQTPGGGEVDSRWLDRLDKEDRALLEELIGFAAPEFTADLTWANGDRRTWQDFRGKVVIVQSWNTRSTAGRKMPLRVERALDEITPESCQVIYLHTPEGAESAQAYLERKPVDDPVVIDTTGEFCDALGIYKRPVNIVLDKHGNVRYAGLNDRGLPQAVGTLLAEEFVANRKPTTRPETEPEKVEFPVFSNPIDRAIDLRGKSAPGLVVESWITSMPNVKDKVTVIDFWATWCGPCVAMIPHMNEIASAYAGDVQVVGITDETREKFDDGMEKLEYTKNMTLDKIHYTLGLDSQARMKRTFGISAIPHVVVISRDWIVRWQGHPSELTTQVMDAIVRADKGEPSGQAGKSSRPNRWANEKR